LKLLRCQFLLTTFSTLFVRRREAVRMRGRKMWRWREANRFFPKT